MSTVDLSKFKTLYNQTALEYVKKLEDTVTLLRTDAANKNAMNEIYIAAHSLKSQSLMMGYLSLAQASLLIERFFHALREGADLREHQRSAGKTRECPAGKYGGRTHGADTYSSRLCPLAALAGGARQHGEGRIREGVPGDAQERRRRRRSRCS